MAKKSTKKKPVKKSTKKIKIPRVMLNSNTIYLMRSVNQKVIIQSAGKKGTFILQIKDPPARMSMKKVHLKKIEEQITERGKL
jgi:hypothetical protein